MKKLLSALLAFVMILTVSAFAEADTAEPELFATVEALQFDKLPEIDGKVTADEWGEPSVAHIKYPENPQTDVSKDDQTDVEFTIWFRYTFDGLYIAAQTPDSSPCNDNVDGSQIWNGDCLQMRLDPYGCTEDQGLFASPSRDLNYSDDYQEFAFAYCKDDGECYAYCWHGVMSGLALQSESGKYGASNDGTTTTYEVYIPWEELLYENMPHVGTTYGIAAALLTATEGENDNKWQNWLEWGSGVINNRDDNICGTNRLVMSGKTVFGGAALTDPDPNATVVTKAAIPEAEGDAVIVDITKLSGEHDMHYTLNDDGSVTFTFDESNDPYVSLNISGQVKIKAEDYPYFALYMKTNDPYAAGEIFYCTMDGVTDFAGGYSVPIEYYEVEGNQVAVAELGDEMGYEGNVLKLRFDAYDGGCSDADESEITVYAAGFFKTYEDAVMFKAEGVSVDLDPAYVNEVQGGSSEDPGTTAEATETEADNTGINETTETVPTESETAAGTEKTTEAVTENNGDSTEKPANNAWIIYVVIGVAVAAVVVIVIIIVSKKKK
ncbi:MAG: hypothetical protein IJT49_07040 [Clostridia bacterium]|nr:hypothetical protein [Clostridia bacterium]